MLAALASPCRIRKNRLRWRRSTSGRTVYAYVGGNPVNRYDPHGQSWVSAIGSAVGCGLAAFGGYESTIVMRQLQDNYNRQQAAKKNCPDETGVQESREAIARPVATANHGLQAYGGPATKAIVGMVIVGATGNIGAPMLAAGCAIGGFLYGQKRASEFPLDKLPPLP